MKIEPKRICWVAPVVAGAVGVEVEEEGGQTDRRAEDDAGGQVPPASPLDADEIHGAGPDDPAADEPEQRAEPEQERARAAGRGDVGERVAGEGLAPQTVKTPTTAETTATMPPTITATCDRAGWRRSRARRGSACRLRHVSVG